MESVKYFKMKHLLSILILLGFISSALAQQSFKPLSEYIQDHDIFNDNAALTYALQRCSAVYDTTQKLIYDQDPETSDDHWNTSVFLFNLAAAFHASLKSMDLETAEKEVSILIKEKAELYMKDAKSNYIRTGNYMMDTYLENDVEICIGIGDALTEATNE